MALIETEGLPDRLATIPPAKMAATVKGIQQWTANAFEKIAEMVRAVKKAEEQSALVLERIGTIQTAEEYEEYLATLRVAKAKSKEFESSRLEVTKPVNDAVSRVNDLAKEGKAGWEKVAIKIEGATSAWRREQQRKADLEAERIRQEQVRLRELELQKAEKKAEKLEAKGQVEAAQAVRDGAELAKMQAPPAATVAPNIPKVAGAHTRRYWHAQVTNPSEVPDQWIIRTVNIAGLEDFAKRTEGREKIPGVEFTYEDKDIVRT